MMNTFEINEILSRRIRRCNFLGVFAYDQLPEISKLARPLMLVVNTDPSYLPGKHWLAIYIDDGNHTLFFDSFGNHPDKFGERITNFIDRNSSTFQYLNIQIQSFCSAACGQFCIFFLIQMDKGADFQRMISKFKTETHYNDKMVCRYVRKLSPSVKCMRLDNSSCLQCCVSGEMPCVL